MELREVKGLLYLLTHLSPRMCLDLRKLELSVVGVHLSDLLTGWCPKNLDRTEQKKRMQQYVFAIHIFKKHRVLGIKYDGVCTL